MIAETISDYHQLSYRLIALLVTRTRNQSKKKSTNMDYCGFTAVAYECITNKVLVFKYETFIEVPSTYCFD